MNSSFILPASAFGYNVYEIWSVLMSPPGENNVSDLAESLFGAELPSYMFDGASLTSKEAFAAATYVDC
ncbi:hypothetical protein FisN_12Lu404 [Fistulifera solaris]|uniref:Uncharacterized protein n=1 Tax=Fistulifera solaris TaxID=1519565 RepID=A0A1Z5JMC3_FISSO|nr:hypothetical protein FisN_12Lu404 [Fistulifera solaris]|eukprot:GAX14931.1 hypothetical protein FisN_12Lu404 [Fistulifera solaris]